MKIYFIFILLVFTSCTNNIKSDKQKVDSTEKNSSCAKPIKDPNNPKPMALMMRFMADVPEPVTTYPSKITIVFAGTVYVDWP